MNELNDSVIDIRQNFDATTTALQVLHGRDLSNKTVVITGGNCGLGYETARALAFHGASVFIACRDLKNGEMAIKRIMKERPHVKITAMKCDLSSFQSTKQFADDFKKLNLSINILILNAGIFGKKFTITEDGFEETFQVNYLSNFYLIQQLKTLIIKCSTRIVLLSSESHRFSDLNIDTLDNDYFSLLLNNNYHSINIYNDTKLCNILLSIVISNRFEHYGVTCNSLHPGNMISTSIARHWWLYKLLFTLVRPFTKSIEQGAATIVYCATSIDLENVTGKYFNDCIQCEPSENGRNSILAETLWYLTEKLLKNYI